MKRVLFLSHDTSRTGAPMVLLYFMQWLKKTSKKHEIDCLALNGGPLKTDFKKASHAFFQVKTKHKIHLLDKFLQKIRRKKNNFEQNKKLLKELKKNKYQLIYANSVVSLKWALEIKKRSTNAKVILHLHELDGVIKSTFPNILEHIEELDFCICVSKMVRDNFIKNYSFPMDRTEVVYEFSKNLLSKTKDNKTPKMDEVFVVGGSGSVNKRKGYDLFIAVAIEVFRQEPNLNIKFNWVGKISNKKTGIELAFDIEKSNAKNKIFFSGEESNPFNRYNNFDVFLMTSREDPFPLVCIEVASLGKPIVCFENATGTQEIVKIGGGKVVPYLQIYEMAKAVIYYATNPDDLLEDGNIAKENFKGFTIENQAPKIESIIDKLIISN